MPRYTQQLNKPIPSNEAIEILAFAKQNSTEGKVLSSAKKTRGQTAPIGHKRLTINLPEEIHKRLRMKSLEEGTTATEIVVSLIKEKLGV